jgi:hypothetical protein
MPVRRQADKRGRVSLAARESAASGLFSARALLEDDVCDVQLTVR